MPMFSIALSRFLKTLDYRNLVIAKHYLERDEVSPNSRPVCGFDIVIKMIKNDVIDVFVPGKNLSDLSNSSFSYLNSELELTSERQLKDNASLPEDFMLNLKL